MRGLPPKSVLLFRPLRLGPGPRSSVPGRNAPAGRVGATGAVGGNDTAASKRHGRAQQILSC